MPLITICARVLRGNTIRATGPAHLSPFKLPGVSHFKVPLKGAALQGGAAATLAGVATVPLCPDLAYPWQP